MYLVHKIDDVYVRMYVLEKTFSYVVQKTTKNSRRSTVYGLSWTHAQRTGNRQRAFVRAFVRALRCVERRAAAAAPNLRHNWHSTAQHSSTAQHN